MRFASALFLAALCAACFGDDRPHGPDGRPGDGDARVDSRPGDPDARIDGRNDPDARPGSAHVLLTEVRTSGADEFIEIMNPTAGPIALDEYYLTDIPQYWQLPAHVAGNVTLTATSADFMVKFPGGTSLAPGEVITVAVVGPAFAASFGTPDFTIAMGTAGATPMAASPVANGSSVTLTNSGEAIILFQWDGARDRVQDVDMVIAGNAPDAANTISAKAPVDGPDGDTAPTAYAADALTLQDMASDADDTGGVLRTYKRIADEVGAEAESGGNGVSGHDETSEQARTTWDSAPSPAGYSAATPGVVPAF